MEYKTYTHIVYISFEYSSRSLVIQWKSFDIVVRCQNRVEQHPAVLLTFYSSLYRFLTLWFHFHKNASDAQLTCETCQARDVIGLMCWSGVCKDTTQSRLNLGLLHFLSLFHNLMLQAPSKAPEAIIFVVGWRWLFKNIHLNSNTNTSTESFLPTLINQLHWYGTRKMRFSVILIGKHPIQNLVLSGVFY